MRWTLEPEHEMLIDAVAGWLERESTTGLVRAGGDPAAFETSLVEEGWLAIGVPEERGGQGGGLLELALTAELLARHCAPASAWLATALALPALDDATAASVIEDGRFAAIVAHSGAPLGPGTIEARDDLLTGETDLVLGADRASLLVVPAGGALYAVEATDAGVSITPRPLLDHSRSAALVSLEGARGRRLDVGDDFLAEAALRSAVLVAADALGAASRLLAMAVEYSGQRTQFGQPIGSFQAMKHAAATMLVAEEAARSIVYFAAASVEQRLPDAHLHAATAKAQVTAEAVTSAESALTMHGAIGYTWEHDLQLFYKRTKLDLALFGSPATWNERIADALQLLPIALAN
jgi:alkylation response protein AidB-like acyl-CoA dehydrogenase